MSYKNSEDELVLTNRESWIVAGLESLKKISHHDTKHDMILIDNSVNCIEELPKLIRSSIPQRCDIITDDCLNKYGKNNKGAGNLEMTNSIREKIEKYDFYIHHEPRTVIRHSEMFDSFFDNPRNLFRNGSCDNSKDNSQFWTGTYFISTKDMIKLLDWVDLNEMCQKYISIEYHIRSFFNLNNILFDTVEDAGILWNDQVRDLKIKI